MAEVKKKKKKKKSRNLIILSLACVLLLGGFLALSQYNKKNSLDDTETTAAEKEALVSYTADDVAKIEVKSREITGKYERSFVYDSDATAWLCASDTDIPIKQSLVKGMLANVIKATSLQEISNDLDATAADYGLANPTHTIIVTLKDGTQAEYYIGDKALTGDYYYYAVKGDNRVHQINSTLNNYVKREFYEFVNAPSYPSFEVASVISVDYEDADTDLLVYYDPADLLLVDAMSISLWYFPSGKEGRYISAGYDQGQELAEAVTGIIFTSCIDYKASDEQLEEYGLTKPAAKMKVTYKVTTTETSVNEAGEEVSESISTPTEFTLLIGKEFEDNGNPYFYACMEGSNTVYKANGKSGILFLMNDYTMSHMLNLWPCQLNISCVDYFTSTYEGVTTTCSIAREMIPQEDGTQKESLTFFVNGKEESDDSFRTFFSELIMLQADRAIEASKIKEDAEVVLDYEFTTVYEGEPTKHIQLLTYNDNYYQLSINGDILYLVTRGDAKDIMKVVSDFQKGR